MISREIKKYDETKHKKQKGKSMELQGGFKKLKHPMFNGNSEEVAEAWLLNTKQFQVYSYDDNLRARLAIFQLSGKAFLWWQEEET